MFVVARRATILIPSGPANDVHRQHLFVCLNDPYGLPKQVLLASVTSVPPSGACDTSCLVNVGDHPFIRHPSFVTYSQARMSDETSILAGVAKGVFHPRDPVSEELLERIVKGLYKSNRIRPFMREFMDLVLAT